MLKSIDFEKTPKAEALERGEIHDESYEHRRNEAFADHLGLHEAPKLGHEPRIAAIACSTAAAGL